jgi:hypothetical protein
LKSPGFFWWGLTGILTMIIILILKSFQICKIDFFSLINNFNDKTKRPHNKYLLILMIVNHLEFAFLYYVHY